MSEIALLLDGFKVAFEFSNIIIVIISCFIGTTIGMLPGIGPINAIAILFPITFSLGLPPSSVMILFAGIYYGSQYGNSISSILLNVPGTSSAAVTAIDGHVLAKKGLGGKALSISAVSSFIGGILSIFWLVIFANWLSKLAIEFGPAEYFTLMIFAFTAISSLSGKGQITKGIISSLLGITIGTIGTDLQSGVERFTFDNLHLIDGVSFIVVVIGFYGIGEVIEIFSQIVGDKPSTSKIGKILFSFKEFKASFWPTIRSNISGFFVGILPGAGATIASFIAYNTEKKIVDKEDNFGKGDLRAVAAPESANNSAAIGAFIPLLILGVPGSETTAVMLGSLLSFGVTPGPLFLTTSPEVFWSFAASMFLGNCVLLFLNLPLVGLFTKILLIPKWVLVPIIITLSFVGVYSISGSYFDIVLTVIFGVIGFIMRKTNFPIAPLILGLILGGLIETNLHRALSYSNGSFGIFFSSGITWFFWGLTILSLIVPFLLKKFKIKI